MRASGAGEAVSNAVQAAVGELAWASVATACTWKNETSQETLRLFDPNLTAQGVEQVLTAPHLSACIYVSGQSLLISMLWETRTYKVVMSRA